MVKNKGIKILGDLQGAYSRRLNIKYKLLCEIIEDKKHKISNMWSPYV